MGMMFKFFGYQFSKMFYRAKIAEKLFIRKRTKKEFLEKVKKVQRKNNPHFAIEDIDN